MSQIERKFSQTSEKPGMTRRDFLRGATGLAIGAATASLWLPESARAQSVSTPNSPTRRENAPVNAEQAELTAEALPPGTFPIDSTFQATWEMLGGVPQQGYGLSPKFTETNPTNGIQYPTQYTERARFEWHPDENIVMLGLLGREQFMAKYPDREVKQPNQYSLPGQFQDFWNTHGGLPIQGHPVSDAFIEKNPTNNQEYLTQYFERARFEWHADENVVMLGLLGREQFLAKYPNGIPAPENTTFFPKEIGDLARDGVMIHNMGNLRGVVDNKTDLNNNWNAIANVAKQYFPKDKFEFFYYDTPDEVQVLLDQAMAKGWKPRYNPDLSLERIGYAVGTEMQKMLLIQAENGTWQSHKNIPNIQPQDRLKYDRSTNVGALEFMRAKDNVSDRNFPPGWIEQDGVIIKYINDPFYSGKGNFPLKVIYK